MNKDNLEKIFNDDFSSSYFPLLAEAYMIDEDYERAKQVCDIGLLLNPDNNNGKFIQAKIAIIENNSKIAIKFLREIIASDNLYINAMKMLVMIYKNNDSNQIQMMKIVHQILALLPGDEFASDILKSSKKIKKKAKPKAKKIIKRVTLKKPPSKIISPLKKAPRKNKDNIDPKMATLTFVDILIKQKQYHQAGNVLEILKTKKTISKNSINIRIEKIIRGLSQEG